MASTAIAVRQALFVQDGSEFQNWLSSLTGESPQQGRMADPATMQSEMPDLPVAGLGDGDDDNTAADYPLVDGPAEPDRQGHGDQLAQSVPDALERGL